MLVALFALAVLVLLGSFFRRPRRWWEKAVVAGAGILLLAVFVAWGLEFVARNA